MNNQVLSIYQMQELQELGIDISKASMLWYPRMAIDAQTGKGYIESYYLVISHIDSKHFWSTRIGKEAYPTFTLLDILEMLPEFLPPKLDIMDYNLELAIRKDSIYYNYEVFDYSPKEDLVRFSRDNMLNNSFNILKWCKQNNYI